MTSKTSSTVISIYCNFVSKKRFRIQTGEHANINHSICKYNVWICIIKKNNIPALSGAQALGFDHFLWLADRNSRRFKIKGRNHLISSLSSFSGQQLNQVTGL
jgi:hypothetical protein